jgi:hypothetical protein
MAPSLGTLIVARCRRDSIFKKKVLQVLYKKLSEAEFKSEHAKKLRKACAALEKL